MDDPPDHGKFLKGIGGRRKFVFNDPKALGLDLLRGDLLQVNHDGS
jgi:hypothetical protein